VTRPARALAPLLLATAALGATGQEIRPDEPPPPPATAAELLDRLEAAWQVRDVEAYAGLWIPDLRPAERSFAVEQFGAEESHLRLFRPDMRRAAGGRVDVSAEVFEVREPRGRVTQWLLGAGVGPDGWRFTDRTAMGGIEGLVHLSLDPDGYVADGMRLELEDFSLEMQSGTLFTSPPDVGLTAMVFVGRGTVRFKPRPPTEQEQLRRFCGSRELVERVDKVFVRLHPDSVADALSPLPEQHDPRARRALSDARSWYSANANRYFVLDATAPRSPWWLLPARGDGLVIMDTGRRGVLTYSSSGSEPEGINLFDSDARRQICLYPRAGGDTDYDEDDGRAADVLHHDLELWIDPATRRIQASSTLTLRLLQLGPTLRLRLDDALTVESVTSPTAGPLMFFRVRDRDSVMVSLGNLAGSLGNVPLTVRYAGVLEPGPIENEVQLFVEPSTDIPLDTALVYTNQNDWYPVIAKDDYATSRLRVNIPEDDEVASGGTRLERPAEGGRKVVEFVLDQPGRYISMAVGHLREVGRTSADGVDIHAVAVGRLRGETERDLELSRSIVEFFQGEFGPMPFSSLMLVEVEGEVPGGHSPPGMVVLSNRPPLLLRERLRDDPARVQGEDDLFLAHEIAHQWWGHGVAGQNYRERWISEAFAHYSAALWLLHARGEDSFQRVMRHYERWALRDTGMGPIHLGHRVGHIDGDAQAFRAVVYDKGAWVLHMLRKVVGLDAFRTALAQLQHDFRYGKIGNDDVREALEQASGRDLRPCFQSWVHGTEIMELRYHWERLSLEGGDGVEVRIRAQHVPAPVPVEVLVRLDGGGEHEVQVTVPPEGGDFEIPLPGRARDVSLNDDRGLLAEVDED